MSTILDKTKSDVAAIMAIAKESASDIAGPKSYVNAPDVFIECLRSTISVYLANVQIEMQSRNQPNFEDLMGGFSKEAGA